MEKFKSNHFLVLIQMSSHFDKMEHELNLLSKNMELITKKSDEIAVNLSGKRDELTRMSSTHFLLNKIQFILELPAKMQTLIGQNKLIEAVDDYIQAKHALDLYSHFPSIKNIQVECTEMLDLIKSRLYDQLANEEVTLSSDLIYFELMSNVVSLGDNGWNTSKYRVPDKAKWECNQPVW